MNNAVLHVNRGEGLDKGRYVVPEVVSDRVRHLIERRYVPELPAGRTWSGGDGPGPDDEDRDL